MQKTLKKVASLILVVIIFYFIGRVIYKEWDKFSEYNWSPNPLLVIFSIIILLIVYILFSHGWTLILKMIGVKIGWNKGLSICLLSIFGRYIPGGIWTVLGRVYLCRLEGIPDSRSGMSILLDQSYTVVSAGVVFAVSLLFWNDTSSVLRVLPVVIVIPLFLFFLHPKPFLKIINPVLSWFGRGHVTLSLSFSNMLILTGYYSFSWLLTGVSFYIFIRAFYPIELHYILIISGIYAISYTAGFIIFFMPAGLGVREGTLTLLLSLFIPTPVAIGISLLSRLWIIGLEILILLFFLINTQTRRMVRTALGW